MKHAYYLDVEGSDTKKLKVSVFYSKGGMSYFTYKNEPRGYWVSVAPVEVEKNEGWSVEKQVLFSGYKQFLFEVKRQSKGADERAIREAENYTKGMVARVAQEAGFVVPALEHGDQGPVAEGLVDGRGMP